LKNLQIIEISSGRIIAEYSFVLDEYMDYFIKAWKKAIEEGLVNESKRSNYYIKLAEDEMDEF